MTTETFDEREAYRKYKIPVRTLQGLRLRGGGPEYIKRGRSVRYRRKAFEQWLDSCTRKSTSDTGDKEARQ